MTRATRMVKASANVSSMKTPRIFIAQSGSGSSGKSSTG
jgi:chloramphenicol 3-O-phosphotransferase